jgi:phenylalanyl-tRNA synthetase beta subunit
MSGSAKALASVSDMMAGLMIVFLFLMVCYMSKTRGTSDDLVKARDRVASLEEELKLTNESPIAVEILPESGGLRYSGLLIKNVKIAASPNWLQHKLKAIGINPINNI